MSDVIYLSDVRLSFPNIAEPQKRVNEKTGKERISYNAEFIMPQNHPGFAQFYKRYGEMALEKAKEHASAVMNMIQSDRKSRCFGAGDEKVKKTTFVVYDGYAGNVFITAGSDRMPQIIQADGSPVDPANTMAVQQMARKLYGGCRVNAAIKPWWQLPNPKEGYGHGVRCDLIAVQFFKDDAPFGEGVVDASGLFGAVQQAAGPSASGAAMPWLLSPSFNPNPAPPMPAAPFGAPTLPSFLGG